MRETKDLEFKGSISNTFLKTVSAFANFNGGKILFGIADDGTTYVFSGSYDENTTLPAGALKINKGEKEFDKTYYFNKDGIMVAGKWLEIDGKWYYFNADGSLAKNTKIDGYEVDEKGVRKD